MYKLLEKQKKLCRFAEQFMILVQMVSIFLIFMVSLYWFMELVGSDKLSFMDSFIISIKGFVKAQFAEQLAKGKAGIDGSLFIFIALIGCVLYIASQFKSFFKFQQAALTKAAIHQREVEEEAFNKQLQADVKRQIMEYNNVVLLLRVSLKSLLKDVYQTQNDVKQIDKKQEEIVLVAVYNMLKTLPGCTFSKDGSTLVVSAKKFALVDSILIAVDKALATLTAQLKPRKLMIVSNIAIDVFPDRVQLKDVYADLKTLFDLNMPNEILCYGNFCNRYELEKDTHFEAFLKGTYDITDEENVWSLVKKG